MQALLDRGLHQRMIGGMEANEIDAPPVAVVGVELWRVLIGQRPPPQKFSRARVLPERSEPAGRPCGAFALDRLLQPRVGVVEVVVDELDRLVEHLMGNGAIRVERRAEIVLSVGEGCHGASPVSTRLLLMDEIGKEPPVRCRHWSARMLTARPCPPPRSTAD